MTSRKDTAPPGAPSPSSLASSTPSPAIRTALAGMEAVCAMILTVGHSLTDDTAEQRATLIEIDRLLTRTHDDLERAEWDVEPSEQVEAAAASTGVPVPSPQTEPDCHSSDRTDGQLRAYLASMRFLRGCGWKDDELDALVHGRDLIERLAVSANGKAEPSLVLMPDEAADVLFFMHNSEPVESRTWYAEPDDDVPSHIGGFYAVLRALERALRGEEAHR